MMKGKLYRRNKDGYIYEVVGQEESSALGLLWIMWNERVGERQFVMDIELKRQVGWELVGTVQSAAPPEESPQEIPAALMK